jgi:rhodanese-related sulfurtransferase
MAMSQGAPNVNPEEAATLIAEGSLLLDVREPDEWAAGHAEDAIHIPLAALPAEVDRLPLDRPIVCVCRSGGRSGQAADWLKQGGYDAWNLSGGMQAWAATGLAVIGPDGGIGTVI